MIFVTNRDGRISKSETKSRSIGSEASYVILGSLGHETNESNQAEMEGHLSKENLSLIIFCNI